MDLADIDTLKSLCRRFGITPDLDAGQHFLVNREALLATVAVAKLSPEDTVLEVGPGFGTLTKELAQRARRVIAVELDPKLLAAAKEILQPYPNVELIHGNFLTLPPAAYQLSAKSYKLVANLPYGITGRFFRLVLTRAPKPALVVVAVQAEVADRLCAPPGAMSLIAVLCQLYGEPRVIARLLPDDFWPPPEVRSAVVALRVRSDTECSQLLDGAVTPEQVLRVARIGFAARRKTLANNLRAGLPKVPRQALEDALASGQVTGNARAQELDVKQWITLAKRLEIHLS